MEANTLKSLKTIKQRVRHVIECYPCVKGDYRLLNYYYNKMFGNYEIRKNPSPESINRMYRKLAEEHPEFRPSERVQKKRARRESIIREGINEI